MPRPKKNSFLLTVSEIVLLRKVLNQRRGNDSCIEIDAGVIRRLEARIKAYSQRQLKVTYELALKLKSKCSGGNLLRRIGLENLVEKALSDEEKRRGRVAADQILASTAQRAHQGVGAYQPQNKRNLHYNFSLPILGFDMDHGHQDPMRFADYDTAAGSADATTTTSPHSIAEPNIVRRDERDASAPVELPDLRNCAVKIPNHNFYVLLKAWIFEFGISLNAADRLLKILHEHKPTLGDEDYRTLPRCAATMFHVSSHNAE